ncbi:MAG: prepilin peptidase [Deltaproteobacteria bacterium]|nr:prepilin peptidase [Deltaproteobacteria bacterium]
MALTVSVVSDLRTRRIYNWVTLPTMGLCLLLRFAGGLRAEAWWGGPTGLGLASGLLGLVILGGIFWIMNLTGGIGEGDVKLAAAVGAGAGYPMVLPCLFFIAVVGGMEALIVLAWQGKLLKTLGGMARSALQKARVIKPDTIPPERTKIPYGVAIAVGTVWGVWWTLSQAMTAPS